MKHNLPGKSRSRRAGWPSSLVCLIAAAAFLFQLPIQSADAATSYGGKANVVGIPRVSSGAGISFYQATTNMEAASAVYNGSRKFEKAVPISKPTLGRMAKSVALRGVWPAALIYGVMEAAEWLFDEDGSVTGTPGEIYTEYPAGTPWFTINSSGTGYNCSNEGGFTLSEAGTNCAAAITASQEHYEWTYVGPSGGNAEFSVYRPATGNTTTQIIGYTEGVTSSAQVEIVPDGTVADEVGQSPSTVHEIARAALPQEAPNPDGSQASNPVRDAWTELATAIQSLESAIQAMETLADANADGVLTQQEVDDFLNNNPEYQEQPAPEVPPIEFPDDYAREDTLQKIEEALNPSNPPEPPSGDEFNDEWNEPQAAVIDEMEDTDLPSAFPTPDFNNPLPGSSACQSMTLSFLGNDMVLPGTLGCAQLARVKDLFGWALYVMTFIYLVGIFFTPGVQRGAR